MKKQNKPVIFWHSSPVKPNETLMIAGEDFTANAIVELTENAKTDNWVALESLQQSRQCIKAVIPGTLKYGAWKCRVRQDKVFSDEFMVNAPEVWWKQGDGGVDIAYSGDWLRLFGKSLCLDGASKIKVGDHELKCEFNDCYELKAILPPDIANGEYPVSAFNGSIWNEAGTVKVIQRTPDTRPEINLCDHPDADPTGTKDSTMAFVQMMERARCIHGGAIIKIPRGRFRIDSGLRPMVFMDSQLFVMENVTLRGAGANLTSLWWPDKEKALPCLLDCANNSSIEDLAIYAQGPLHSIIKGDSNVRIENVLIRANPFFMTIPLQLRPHHKRPIPKADEWGGPGIELWGENGRIINCDILSKTGIAVYNGRGSVISNNKICGFGNSFLGGSEIVFENNEYHGGMVSGGSCCIGLFGATLLQHVYFRGNRAQHLYTGDHECLTFDGHGTAYFGKIINIDDNKFELVDSWFAERGKGSLPNKYGTVVFVVDGRGTGQLRFVTDYTEDKKVKIDRPWDVLPDDTSYIAIGCCNRQHLIVDNVCSDGGTIVQLYPGNCECIVAGNKGIRTSNFNSLGYMGQWAGRKDLSKMSRVDLSWYNQFLDNETLVGNGWGGGVPEVDRWLGGETEMLVHGACRMLSAPLGETSDPMYEVGETCWMEQTPEWVQNSLGEDVARKRNLSPSRWQVVRRHCIHNNGLIRVRGLVTDVIVEHCRIADSDSGIRVDAERDFIEPYNCGLTVDWRASAWPTLPFQAPEGVLIRENQFTGVKEPYTGNALDTTVIIDAVPKKIVEAENDSPKATK